MSGESGRNRWYVVRTHPRAERTALQNLMRQGYRAYLPVYGKRRRHARREEIVRAPLFPRYLFVAFDAAHARWRAILSTIGICQLIACGDRPLPVPEGIVEEIRAREDEHGMVALEPESPFTPGDVVQITRGPMSDQVGLFDGLTDDQRVCVLLDILGRQVRIALPDGAVAAYA